MTWRLAKSLVQLREQVNAKFPGRSKDSDGSIGDEHHSARESDHNPDTDGIVHAIDITHDPAHGFDSYKFADWLLIARDSRIKYVISNSRIGSGAAGPSPWTWRKYTGINKHDHHVHISVKSGASADDVREWLLDGYRVVVEPTFKAPPPTLRRDASGDDVKRLQGLLFITTDGSFGPRTEDSVKKFQAMHGLVPDGIVGPQTWYALTPKETT